MPSPAKSLRELSCADDYDPNSMAVAKAREFIQAYLNPITGTEKVNIRAALGRVLAEDIISPFNVPAHVNSAMDGYAVRFKDLNASGETVLRLAGIAFAGKPYTGKVSEKECVRIMTGAVLPQGTDTVIMQEHARAQGHDIRFDAGHKQGQNIRQAGEDLAIGQVVLKTGKHIRPAELGLIASLGIAEITVHRRLRVAFFSTGDELRSIGSLLEEGQIYDSNRYTIYGMLRRLGAEVLDMGVVKDDPASLERALSEAAATADVVITSGGVSVGEADYIKELLSRLGEVVFWKIAMKPGRPLAYGKIGQAHFFGLPGNPVSVMVTFYQFVREALLILMGRKDDYAIPTLKATCVSALKKAPGRTEFQRGILSRDTNGTWSVRVTGEQGSGILRSMSEANCFIILPESQGNVAPGTLVEVQVLNGLV
ncbi:MAG TPA: gephyrin-like molybdotransferase Glp [Burkholderiales bacterium]|nr:gephyrin-like molybdotransferase Glp [Burkholderiales bacterium]